MQRSRPEERWAFSRSLGRLGNGLAFLGRCETLPKGTFVGDDAVRVSKLVADRPRYGALFLNLPRLPLLCRRWLRYPWIDCVDKMGRVLFRNTA